MRRGLNSSSRCRGFGTEKFSTRTFSSASLQQISALETLKKLVYLENKRLIPFHDSFLFPDFGHICYSSLSGKYPSPPPPNGANVFCFPSSLHLLSPATTAVYVWIHTCHLSTLNLHCIAGSGLPNHMMGEVSWDPKRRRS